MRQAEGPRSWVVLGCHVLPGQLLERPLGGISSLNLWLLPHFHRTYALCTPLSSS